MTLISRVFGYLRDSVMMITFGAGAATDAFLVAFRLPNFLRRLFSEGAFYKPLYRFFPHTAKPVQTMKYVNCLIAPPAHCRWCCCLSALLVFCWLQSW